MIINRLTIVVFALAAVLLMASTAKLAAQSGREVQAVVNHLISYTERGESIMKEPPPGFLMDDKEASDYCRHVLESSDDKYAQDTARAGRIMREAEWLTKHISRPEGKAERKLAKKGYDLDRIFAVYQWADMMMSSVYPRYDIMKTFCNKQLQRRRKALGRTMPEGALVKFEYGEYGSSRPEPHEVQYTLKRGDDGQWMLNGRETGQNVAEKIRLLAVQNGTYRCLDSYDEPPSFEHAPHLLGGPPSWYFRCTFEGGTISSGSECMPVPVSCSVIVEYVRDTFKEICRSQQNQN